MAAWEVLSTHTEIEMIQIHLARAHHSTLARKCLLIPLFLTMACQGGRTEAEADVGTARSAVTVQLNGSLIEHGGFDSPFKGSRTQVTVTRLVFLGGDVAVTDMAGVQPTETGMLKTRMRYVMKKNGKRWEIVAGQNTDVKPAPASGAGRPQGAPTGQ